MKFNPPKAPARIGIQIQEWQGKKNSRSLTISVYDTTLEEVHDLILTALKAKAKD